MKIPKLIEILFDTLYLLSVMIIGILLLVKSDSHIATLYGVMAIILLIGDSFHLVPRVLWAFTSNNNKFQKLMGLGKMLTSITMTVFYILLWHIGIIYYSLELPFLTISVYIISFSRVLICLLPGNKWVTNDAPLKWSISRNIPFLLLGIMVICLYLLNNISSSIFNYMWLAITISFLFYIPVTLFSKKYPKIGMLMLPKSCAYVWILVMGLSLLS